MGGGNRKARRQTIGRKDYGGKVAPRRLLLELLESRELLSVNVVTYHNDLTRQGLNSSEAVLNPANVNSSQFGKLFSYSVAGQIYAQPLYVSNLDVPGVGVKNVVYVVTEHNDVYAFDAQTNAGPNGGVLWHVNLGTSAAMPNSFFGNRYGPYHDINPQVGITGTPVIDLATNTMYLDSFTNDVVGQNAYSHHIWALDITTGQQKVSPMLVTAVVQGAEKDPRVTPTATVSPVTFQATQQLQRSALSLVGGTLYVPYAGFADTDPYHGWMLGFDPTTLQLTRVLNTTPNLGTDQYEGEAGIWQGGYGPASDGSRFYVMTGNGDFQANIGDFGDSFLEITPDGSVQPGNLNGYGLSVTDYFTPFNEQSLATADTDLGSGGVMLLPDSVGSAAHPRLLVGAGKQGTIYLIDRDAMGGFNAATDNVVQKASLGHSEFGGPAYFNGRIYYHANGDVLKAYSIANGVMSAAPVAQSAMSYSFPGATPSISSAGTANGIVWDLQYNSAHGVLRAYDATTLAELYNSNQLVARDQLPPGVKFATPTIADGRVFVGTDGTLAVFGLVAPPTLPPSAPTGLSISNTTALQLRLTWTDAATTESIYKIERSTDGVNFDQVGVASVNATSYTDTTVLPEVRYYYRVKSSNSVGDSPAAGPVNAVVLALATPTLIYHFDEGLGLSTADSAGSNAGTLVGATKPAWVGGRIGAGALSFSGDGVTNSLASQSAVQSASSLAGTLGGTSTLAFWVNTTQIGSNTPTAAPAITGVDLAGSTNDVRWGFLDATGRIGVSAGASSLLSPSPINDGQWHHIALTRNSSTGALQVYVDGTLRTSTTGETGTKSTAFRLIGAQSALAADGTTSLGATYFNGQLDDLRIFNRVLTASEIAAIGKPPAAPTGLTATPYSSSIVQLAWTNASAYAENVEIWRKTGPGGAYQQIATLAGAAASYNDTGRTPGTQYFYQVRATDLAGASAYSNEANVTPPRPEVVARYAFYNQSNFDGQNGSSNIADNLAIATDKQALLPGQTATFANYTSYSGGMNGVIIDVSNFDGVISLADFTLLVGNTNSVEDWDVAPAPSFVSMYPGWGVGGSTRLELVWDNGAIKNEWLQVTLKADAVTNLLAPDVFYFGNAVGESGNSAASAAVDAADEIGARANGTSAGAASITNPYDFNRDKQVDAEDQLLARANRSGLAPLKLITVPAIAAVASAADSAALSSLTAIAGAGIPGGLVPTTSDALSTTNARPASHAAVDAALGDASGNRRFRPALGSRFVPTEGGEFRESELSSEYRGSTGQERTAPADSQPTDAALADASLLGRRAWRQLRRGLFAVALAAGLAATAGNAATVVVGTHLLSANTPGQAIPVWITGGESVAGLDFFAQIGDGGAILGGVNVRPVFSNVDLLTGTIFAGNNNGAFGDPNGVPPGSNAGHPLLWVDGTTTTSGTVAASGLLATLVVDTTGQSGGSFPLLLTGVASSLGSFNTGLVDGLGAASPLTVTNGMIKVAPGMSADFNENGAVNGADLTLWRAGFGTPGGALHGQGDATGEGVVDGADLLTWQRQNATPVALSAYAAIPEPTTGVLLALAFSSLFAAGRTKCK
jgi:hypothetical protein